MKTVVVLAMHGIPPKDFPHNELMEFFSIHSGLEHSHSHHHSHNIDNEKLKRYSELERKIKNWPRTPENDPFFIASQELALKLSEETGYEIVLGFNEFCAPDLNQAFDEAVHKGAEKIVVVTPMLTQGGSHAEEDIPKVIRLAEETYPDVEFIYAWPFETKNTARFLGEQIRKFIQP